MSESVDFFSKGMAAYLARDFKEAIELFTKALEDNPENVNYYFYRGSSFQSVSDFSKADSDFSKALERFSACIPIRYSRSEVRLLSGDTKGSLEDLTYIIENACLEKGEGQWLSLSYLNRGLILIEAGDLESALIDFDEAEQLAKEIDDKLLLARIGDELEKSGF